MRKTLIGFLILPALFSVSCEKIENEDIQVVMPSEQLNLVDTSGRSCKLQTASSGPVEDDLTAVTVLVNRFGIKWTGKNPLRIAFVRFTLTGGGISGEYTQVISSAELGYMWKGNTGDMVVELSPSDTPTQTSTRCNITLGGVPITNRKTNSYGQGKLTVYGTTSSGDTSEGVSATAYFGWTFFGAD